MKTAGRVMAGMVAGTAALCVWAGAARATPSTEYWTPCITDIQGYKVLHLGIDDYFTVGKKKDGGAGSFPTDAGLTLGVLPFEKIQAEVGVDMLQPTDDPFSFNAKVGTPEGSMFGGSPALSVGVFGLGTKKDVTDQNVAFGVVGKTVPVLGRVFAGGYTGNDKVLVDGNGKSDESGWMVAWDHGYFNVKDKAGDEYSRVMLSADYASGKNAIGGGGVGVYYFFTKNISILTGPVWFNDSKVNGEQKWTTQLDVNIPF